MKRTVSLKTYVISIVVISLMLLATTRYIWANPGFSGRDLYLDDLPSEAEFVINTDGTNYWATRYDGTILYSGTNATTVINNALTHSGKTFIKRCSSNYTISGTIQIDTSNVTLESDGALLWLADGVEKTIMHIGTGASTVKNLVVKGLELDGNRAGQVAGTNHGILIENAEGVWIVENNIHGTSRRAHGFGCNIRIQGGANGATNHVYILNNKLWDTGDRTIEMGGHPNPAHAPYDIIISGNLIFDGFDRGICLDANNCNYAAKYVTITNNIIHDLADGSAIAGSASSTNYITIDGNIVYGTHKMGVRLDNAVYYVISNNILTGGVSSGIATVTATSGYGVISGNYISNYDEHGISLKHKRVSATGNTIKDCSQDAANTYSGIYAYGSENLISGNIIVGTDHKYAIEEAAGHSDNNLIVNNDVTGGFTTGGILKEGASTVVRHNEGFVTENSGDATIASGETIAHGIDSSLNIAQGNSTVLVTPYTTIYDSVPVVVGCNTTDSTNIIVTAYWVNGTEITDDALDIWWSVEYRN